MIKKIQGMMENITIWGSYLCGSDLVVRSTKIRTPNGNILVGFHLSQGLFYQFLERLANFHIEHCASSVVFHRDLLEQFLGVV
jgi:hypothetical protein